MQKKLACTVSTKFYRKTGLTHQTKITNISPTGILRSETPTGFAPPLSCRVRFIVYSSYWCVVGTSVGTANIGDSQNAKNVWVMANFYPLPDLNVLLFLATCKQQNKRSFLYTFMMWEEHRNEHNSRPSLTSRLINTRTTTTDDILPLHFRVNWSHHLHHHHRKHAGSIIELFWLKVCVTTASTVAEKWRMRSRCLQNKDGIRLNSSVNFYCSAISASSWFAVTIRRYVTVLRCCSVLTLGSPKGLRRELLR